MESLEVSLFLHRWEVPAPSFSRRVSRKRQAPRGGEAVALRHLWRSRNQKGDQSSTFLMVFSAIEGLAGARPAHMIRRHPE